FAGITPLLAQDSHTTDTDRKWSMPDHAVVQFAANIGLLSAGPGYSYLKDKVNSEIMYGFTPGFESNTSIHMLTLKSSYHPFKKELSENYMLDVLRIGTGISYSYGPQFHTSWPSRYPESYYWWASSLRFTPFIGTAISREVGAKYTHIKRVELYGEIGSTDLDIVSKWGNKNLSLWDITNLAFGTKLVF
ncbi:MAG TPA: hypothetical protein VK927_09885, partial [Adhaeribacter sp.]|nr:hypothetical protein [Adhaeribacter sp.]